MYHRPKIPAIYKEVSEWYEQTGAISYVAHAITNGPTATRLAPALHIGARAGGGPENHPDQVYWGNNNSAAVTTLKQIVAQEKLIRVDIDCTLLPCTVMPYGCLFRVPHLVKVRDINISLRIFSHRDERGSADIYTQTNKRFFNCDTNDTNQALVAAFNGNGGWCWDPWKDVYD